MTASGSTSHRRSGLAWALSLVVVAGLAVDAVIHVRLAEEYQFAFPEGIGGGTLFRIEAAAAVVAAVAVLAWGRRPSYWLAVLVAGSAFLAVVSARYVEVPSIGPLPSMYEPLWYLEKTISAVAEVVAALAALVLVWISPSGRGRERGRQPAASATETPLTNP